MHGSQEMSHAAFSTPNFDAMKGTERRMYRLHVIIVQAPRELEH